MACGKTKMNCIGARQFAMCIETQIEPPEFSVLFEEGCLTVEDVLEDLYTVSGEIKEEIDLSTITASCITLPTVKDTKNFIQLILDQICELKTTVEEQAELIATQQLEITDLQNNNCP